MCRYKELRVGDKIRFSQVPAPDREQFERTGDPFTVRILEKLVADAVVCTIARIDEYGFPWFDYTFTSEAGEEKDHRLAVMNDHSWEKVREDI